MAYRLDVTMVDLFVIENMFDGLQNGLSRIVSTAAACPDKNGEYATSLLPLKDRKIHYSHFTGMERNIESKLQLKCDCFTGNVCHVFLLTFFSSFLIL
jgi:hypothetical protein